MPTTPDIKLILSHFLAHLLHYSSPNHCIFNTHFFPWILPSNSENVLAMCLADNTSYHRDGTLDSYLFVHTHNAYAGSDCWSVCRIDHTGKYECEQHFEVRANAADCTSFESQLCLQENIPPHLSYSSKTWFLEGLLQWLILWSKLYWWTQGTHSSVAKD